MSKTLFKNAIKEIKGSKARFISIVLIVALGVGFFVGIKCTNPSMTTMAEDYYSDNNLMDFRILSTVGFDEEDVKEVSKLDGVSSVMPGYYTDVKVNSDGSGNVMRLMSVPYSYKDNDSINTINIKEGRLPQKEGELAVESAFFSSFKVGDKIAFEDKVGDKYTSDTLKSLEYTIVGIIQSPMYISFERGTTTIGDGKLNAYAYVCMDEFKSDRFFELYLRLNTSKEISPFSDEYDSLIDDFQNQLENIGVDRCDVFTQENITSAQKELDDNKKKYEEEKEKVNSELKSAKEKIDEGESTYYSSISSAQSQIDSAQSQITNGEIELENGKAELKALKEKSESEFKKARDELDSSWKEYNSAYSEFENGKKAEALEGISQLQNGITATASYALAQVSSYIPAEMVELKEYIDGLAGSTDYTNALANLESAQNALLSSDLGDLAGQLSYAINEVNSLQSSLDEAQGALDYAENEFATNKAKLEQAESEYDEKRIEYDKKVKEAEEKISSSEALISQSKAQLASSSAELETSKIDGLNEINSAKNTYIENKNKAEKELKEAKNKLDDAQKKLDDVVKPKWYVYTRDDNPGYSSFIENCDRVDKVSLIFPLFFLLVAMLVCLTTMTRLVEEKRIEIGTLKALGYSNKSIVSKFLIYSATAAIIGSILGCAVGIPILPRAIYGCYNIMYDMLEIPIVVSYTSLIIGVVAAIVSCVFVSIYICYKSLKENTASLMRQKTPKVGKRILLERITPIWNRLSFSSKVTQRNIFRYKSRLFMTTLGIAGCTALIVAGFGLYDSIADIVDIQYGELYKYNVTIVSSGDDGDFTALLNTMDEDKRIESYELSLYKSISVSSDKSKVSNDVYLNVPSNPSEINNLLDLRNRITKEKLTIENDKAIISEKLSNQLGVNVGDYIYLDSDKEKAVVVSGICENYIYGQIFITPSTCRKIYDKDFEYNLVNLYVPNMDEKMESQISSDYLSRDDVIAVTIMTSAINSFEDMISSMKMITFILVFCAGALAIVVLYNLTNINLAERKREIATIKVLGFRHMETAGYVYRENIILTIIGIILGLIMGVFLTRFIVVTVEIDSVMFGRNIYFLTFVFATIGTIFFSALVNFIMYFRIKKINMVESLKSIE